MNRRLSQNTIILIISNGGSAILSFLIAVLIGRAYGDDGLGTYAGILAWIFPLSFIVEFGFGTMMTRDLAQNPEHTSDYLDLTWQFRYWVGGTLSIIIFVLAMLSTTTPLFIILSIPLIIILPAYSAYSAIFRAYQRMLPIAILNLGMLIAQLMGLSIAIVMSASLIWLFILNTATSLGQLLTAIWIYRRYFYQKPKTSTGLTLRDLIRPSHTFAIAGILSAIQARFGIIWLEAVSSSAMVGLFVASLRFIDGARMIPNAIFGAVYPALSALSHDQHQLNSLFSKLLLGLAGYSIIVVGILWLFAEEILTVTFGQEFAMAESTLILLGVTLVPFILRSGWTLYWYAQGREQLVNRVLVVNLLLLVSLPTLLWIIGIKDHPLNLITHTMLYTEVMTLALMAMREVQK